MVPVLVFTPELIIDHYLFSIIPSLPFFHHNISPDSEYVTCGSIIKLKHTEKGKSYYLSSDERISPQGNDQQLVTASPESDNMTTFWIIRESHQNPSPCQTGTKIPYGSKVRLQHLESGVNLHSHQKRSPLSGQQEVTGFGENGEGDTGDDWVVNAKSNTNGSDDKYWRIGSNVQLMHFDTKVYLGSSEQAVFNAQNCGRGCPIMNHLEVFGRRSADSFTTWRTDTGIFISK